MFLYKCIFFAFIVTVQCGRLYRPTSYNPTYFEDREEEEVNHQSEGIDDGYPRMKRHISYQDFETMPQLRFRRQLEGSMSTDPDGSANLNGKFLLGGNDNNKLSAVGSVNGLKNDASKFGPGSDKGPNYRAAGGGLLLENRNGHALSVTGQHIPSFGNQLTAAGKVNLLHTDNHHLDANAFVTRNMPKSEFGVPNFNKYGGSLDYMYKDKIGGALGMSHTDLFKKTDYSAIGKFNIFKTPDSSLDLHGGFSKSVSPFMPRSSWEPFAGATYRKYF